MLETWEHWTVWTWYPWKTGPEDVGPLEHKTKGINDSRYIATFPLVVLYTAPFGKMQQWQLVYVCVFAGVCGRQPPAEELEGHRHLTAGDRGGLLAHHHVCGRPHTRYVRRRCICFYTTFISCKNRPGLTWVNCIFPSGAPWQQQVKADCGGSVQTRVQRSRPRGHVDQWWVLHVPFILSLHRSYQTERGN